ncbi:MAG: TonB-dependent receptor [Flavobacteriaceae bacterium]|nr:TonB-dependent receptor [Flavobacteriaceae bacterium]
MKKNVLLILVLLFGGLVAHAQNGRITGNVSAVNGGTPLPGVNILVKNTTNGTNTDFDGNFILDNVKQGDVLVFSYLGFKTIELTVSSSNISVQLEDDTQALAEVVVIGYGTQAKKEVTGAVNLINAETIAALKPLRFEDALQGQSTGVQIIPSSGSPGSSLNIRIRGISSNGNNRPLIVVDGNITEDALTNLNPNDIESITTLKDASAAIYGTRAANGVILITTKTGKKNTAATFAVNSYVAFQETPRKLPVLNATEYALLINEARTNAGQTPLFNDVSSFGKGTDFQDKVFETAPIFNQDISVSGGSEKSTYSLGAGYLTQDGIVARDKSNFDRFTSRLSFTTELSKYFTFNTSLFYTNSKRKTINESGLGSVLFNALNMSPLLPVRDENGDFTLAEGLGNEVINPLAQIANTFNEGNTNKINGTAGLKFKLDDHWSAETRFGFNYSLSKSKSFSPIAFFGSGKVFNNSRSSVTEIKDDFNDYTWDAFINYKNTFYENHNVEVTAGTTVFKNHGDFFNATGFDVPNNSYKFADLSLTNNNLADERFGNGQFEERLVSYFGRFQYNYSSKYLFSFSLRRDASSNFGPNESVAYFPSGSLGWVVTEESFLQDNDIVNFLKLRGSFGVLGNDRIVANTFRSLLSGEATAVFDDQLINGKAVGRIPNPNIRWEEQDQLNIGFDLTLLKNFDITADFFRKTTRDLLLEAPVSGIIGSSAPGSAPPFINAGSVRNRGVEFSVNYKTNITKDLKITVGGNFTALENEVLSVNNDVGFVTGGSFGVGQEAPSRMQAGKPLGYFFGLKTDGIFQNQQEVDAHATQANARPGEIRFVDINKDGVVDNNDRTDIGSSIPDVTFNFNLSLEYKNFDFSASAFGQAGNEIVRNYERNQPLTNKNRAFLNRWTGPGTSNTQPLVTTGATSSTLFSDFFVEDGDFLRIQTIQLGYTIPKSITQKAKISNLRLYAQVNNLYTFTDYSGFDPAISSGDPVGGGIDPGFFPTPRSYIFGINLNF